MEGEERHRRRSRDSMSRARASGGAGSIRHARHRPQPRRVDPNYLEIFQFDALLVRLRIDGKDVYLDPGEKLCPYGQLHWSHALTGAIEENGKEPTTTPPNNLKDAITAHTADLTVDVHGNLTGTVKILMNGPSALTWRQLNLIAGADEVREAAGGISTYSSP